MESYTGSDSGSSSTITINSGNNGDGRRVRQATSEGIDRISNLPEVILLHILSFLPLKEWIIISLVSKRWRYLWTKMSTLNLDEAHMINNIIKKASVCPQCGDIPPRPQRGEIPPRRRSFPCLRHSITAARRRFAELVDKILLLHSGCTMDSLQLSFFFDAQDAYTRRIDTWVRYALTSKIKELKLNFYNEEVVTFFNGVDLRVRATTPTKPYSLPHGSFAPKLLKSLTLTFCKFTTSRFISLGSLQGLILRYVKIEDCSIGEIASKCPLLEDLVLERCSLPDRFLESKEDIMIKRLSTLHCTATTFLRVDILAPELVTLTIVGTFFDAISIREATKLITAQISFIAVFAESGYRGALTSLLTDLRHCQKLTLCTSSLQNTNFSLALPQELPIAPLEVQTMRFVVLNISGEFPTIVCLLRSCPNLKGLIIHISEPFQNRHNMAETTDWETQTQPIHRLPNSIKELTITGLLGRIIEMQMIKFLVKNTDFLEKLEIEFSPPQNYMTHTDQEIRQCHGNIQHLCNFIRRDTQVQLTVSQKTP